MRARVLFEEREIAELFWPALPREGDSLELHVATTAETEKFVVERVVWDDVLHTEHTKAVPYGAAPSARLFVRRAT